MTQAAIGVRVTVVPPDVSVSVSPVPIVFDAVRAMEHRKLPAEVESHREMWEMTSPFWPTGHAAHAGALLLAMAPAAAAAKVMVARVVLPEAAVVPDAPGSPVCSLTPMTVLAVMPCRRRTSSHGLA